MISNLLSFTAFLHGVLVSYGAFVCVLLKDCPPLFATKVIHGIMVPSFFCISKVFVWKCVWPLYLSLSLPPSFSLWFHNTCHLMLFTQYSLLDQVYFCTLCLSIVHFKFTNKMHQLFTDYLLRLPYSELLETHLFRSRANRRLVSTISLKGSRILKHVPNMDDIVKPIATHLKTPPLYLFVWAIRLVIPKTCCGNSNRLLNDSSYCWPPGHISETIEKSMGFPIYAWRIVHIYFSLLKAQYCQCPFT